MYRRKPGNPKIEELNKSYKDRSYNLSNLLAIKQETPNEKGINVTVRLCAWCANEKLHHGNQKYCSSECSESAMAWAYPQKEDALKLLLIAQSWKCKTCQFDYLPHMEAVLEQDRRRYGGSLTVNTAPWYYLKRLKSKLPREHRPEVDHVIPIYKGGQSIGLDNHQAICYTCHKSKTSQDLKKNKV